MCSLLVVGCHREKPKNIKLALTCAVTGGDLHYCSLISSFFIILYCNSVEHLNWFTFTFPVYHNLTTLVQINSVLNCPFSSVPERHWKYLFNQFNSEGTSFGGPLLTAAFQVHLVVKVYSRDFMFGLITQSSSSGCYHGLEFLLSGFPAPGGGSCSSLWK